MSTTKVKIVVYESSISARVIKEFDNLEDFERWADGKHLHADQVAVNGQVLLGWDELEYFI